MNGISAFRPLNIVIVGTTQLVFYFGLIVPFLSKNGVIRSLSNESLILLVTTTIIVTTCGYLVNDLYDFKTDHTNNKRNHTLSIPTLKNLYIGGLMIGAFTSYFLAQTLDHLEWWLLYPFVTWVLFLYTQKFQKLPLIGNVIVALFCSASFGIIAIGEIESILTLNHVNIHDYNLLLGSIVLFLIFAFTINLIREIVKDIEDILGDTKEKYQTLPIKIGIPRSITIVISSIFLQLIIEAAWILLLYQEGLTLLTLCFISIVFIHCFYLFYRASKLFKSEGIKSLKTQLKIHMMLGILFLSIFKFFI